MKDLMVDSKGDLIISKHDLQFVRDRELTLQKTKLILSTNKGEWLLDVNEGINFRAILIKNPNQDEILSTVLDGLKQIDETFVITEHKFEMKQRHLILTFKAVNDNGEEISLTVGNITDGEMTNILVCTLTANDILNAGDAISATCICNTDSLVIECDV
jgi:hypothetical protein